MRAFLAGLPSHSSPSPTTLPGATSAGADEGVLPDHRAVEHDRAHAHQHRVLDGAGVDDGLVADGHVRADAGGEAAELGVRAIVADVHDGAVRMLVRSPMRMKFTSPRITVNGHTDTSSPGPRRRSRWRRDRRRRARRAWAGCRGRVGCPCADFSPQARKCAAYTPVMDIAADTPIAELRPTLDRLRAAWQAGKPDAGQRRDDLRRLRDALKRRLDEMAAAISADFGHRAKAESLIADGMTVLNEIDHLRRHLRGWMKPGARAWAGASCPRARKPGGTGRRGRRDRAVELPGEPGAGAARDRHRRRQPRVPEAVRTHAAHQRLPCADCWPRCSPGTASPSPKAAPRSVPRSPRCRSTTSCSPVPPPSGAR